MDFEEIQNFIESDEFKPFYQDLTLQMLADNSNIVNNYLDHYGLYHIFEDRDLIKSFAKYDDAKEFIELEGRQIISHDDACLIVSFNDNLGHSKICQRFVFSDRAHGQVLSDYLGSDNYQELVIRVL